jgi:hypothetical protein
MARPRPESITPMDTTIYRYFNREWTRDELRADSEAAAAGLDPEQWIGGEFNFDEWLSGSILTGHIEKVDTDAERTAMRIASGTKLGGSTWRGGQANIASCSEQKRLSNAG